MANEIARGGIGNVWVRQESSLGTSAASWEGVRCEGFPSFSTSTMKLIENHIAGHRHPLERELPEHLDMYMEDAITIKSRLHRASTDGDTPIMSTFFQAGGWQEDVGGASTTDGTPTVTAIDVASATGMASGECVLIEVTPGVYHPVLIANLAGATITPSIALSAAPAASEVVEICHALTPTTQTGYC